LGEPSTSVDGDVAEQQQEEPWLAIAARVAGQVGSKASKRRQASDNSSRDRLFLSSYLPVIPSALKKRSNV